MIVPHVEVAGRADATALAGVITDAFLHLPCSAWLVPDLAARHHLLHRYLAHLVRHVLVHGVVHTTDYRDAAALWLPCGGGPGPEPTVAELVPIVGVEHAPRFHALAQARRDRHPVGAVHEELVVLAVAPYVQGAGIGSALLRSRHQYHDARGLPGYVQAATLELVDYYASHGYQRVGEPIRVMDGVTPVLWPMRRPPRRARRAGAHE